MYVLEMGNLVYFMYRLFAPVLFWPKRWLSNSALPYHSSGPSWLVFEAWQGIAASSRNPRSPLLPSLLFPPPPVPRVASIDTPLVLTHVLQTDVSGEDLGMDGDLGPCGRAEGCTGMRWQGIPQISPLTKIRMRNRNRHRTIAKSGLYPDTFIHLLSIFPRENSHWRSQIHSAFAPCEQCPGHYHQEVGSGPLSVLQERSRGGWKLQARFRWLSCKFMCLKRDF